MKIVFHIAALKEFRDERRYYNARAPGLGDRLIAIVDGTLGEIARAPHSFPRDRKHPRARRARLSGKFPHALIFKVIEADDVVVLVALEHGRRKPGAWAKRLR
jgi:hypothetical protein